MMVRIARKASLYIFVFMELVLLVVSGSGHIGCKKSHHTAAAMQLNLLTKLRYSYTMGDGNFKKKRRIRKTNFNTKK